MNPWIAALSGAVLLASPLAASSAPDQWRDQGAAPYRTSNHPVARVLRPSYGRQSASVAGYGQQRDARGYRAPGYSPAYQGRERGGAADQGQGYSLDGGRDRRGGERAYRGGDGGYGYGGRYDRYAGGDGYGRYAEGAEVGLALASPWATDGYYAGDTWSDDEAYDQVPPDQTYGGYDGAYGYAPPGYAEPSVAYDRDGEAQRPYSSDQGYSPAPYAPAYGDGYAQPPAYPAQGPCGCRY